MFKFYIDGQLTDQPDNDMDLVTTIKRDRDLGGMFVTQEVTLQYSGQNDLEAGTISGYTYLKDKYDTGTCNQVEIIIWDEVSATETFRVYTGVIKVPAMKVNEQRVILESKIDDNSFYSFIKNNGNIKFSLYATKTKNGEIITPPEIYTVDMFNSEPFSYLNYIGEYFQGYRLYDVLAFLVPAITDNRVTFESDLLQNFPSPPDAPGEPTEIFIFDGYALSHPNTQPAVLVSFNQIVSELFKLKNTFFFIDNTDPDAPVLRLEHISWFYIGTTVLQFTEPLDVKSYVDTKNLYGTIKVGASYNPGGAGSVYTWVTGTSYFGWDEEIYTPFGQCNLDTELNLINEFYITSNAVNDQVNGAVDSQNDNMFLVECSYLDTSAHTAIAIAYDQYSPNPLTEKYYNLGLNNVNKLNIHGSDFHAALTNTQSAGSDVFRAETGQDEFIMNETAGSGLVSIISPPSPAVLEPVSFADELGPDVYDPGGNYNNTGYYYTVPVDGTYSFGVNLDLEFLHLKSCEVNLTTPVVGTFTKQFGVDVTITIKAYEDNTFANLIDSATQTFRVSQNGTFTYGVAFVGDLTIGNAVRVETSSQFIVLWPQILGSTPATGTLAQAGCGYGASEPKAQVVNLSTSSFECNGTPDGSAIVSQPALDLFKSKVLEFGYDIDPTDFRSILALPYGRMEIIKDEVTRYAWIDQIQHSTWTGRATLKLITSDATT